MYQRQHGFTITETLVAAVIFSIAISGIFAAVGTIKKPSGKTDRSLEAAYMGQRVLEGLRKSVDAEKWNDPSFANNKLLAGTHDCEPSTFTPAGSAITYQCTYTVTQQSNGARRVDVNVTWPDS